MQTFSFTVITDGADIMTDESYKTLLDAGCDDATVGSANGVQYVHSTETRKLLVRPWCPP